MSPSRTLPESLDLNHHVIKRVRGAQPSAMKAMGRLLSTKKNLALRIVSVQDVYRKCRLLQPTDTPSASLFPMSHATFTLPSLHSLDGDVLDWQEGRAPTELVHLKKTGLGTENDEGGILDLNDALQYGLSNGFTELVSKLEELNELLHGKAIADSSVYVTLGNTDGVSKAFGLLVEPDVDTVLVEEYSFASSLNSARAKGAKLYPIKVDKDGLVPEDLEQVLSTWNVANQGRKPHVLYTIPCGQNPTGSIQPPERYDAIYAIASKHDVVIIEDDPYFALQYTEYQPDEGKRAEELKEVRSQLPPAPKDARDDDVQTIARVFNHHVGVKSYLSRDVEGRVLRIDTFSKVFGPGVRLGWVTGNSHFVDRLLRIGETSTQVPNGLSQGVLASYLSDKHWGLGGFLRWKFGVRLEYQQKRDYFLDRFAAHVPADLVTTVPCGAGMFQWLRIEIASHPRYRRLSLDDSGAPSIGLSLDTVGQELAAPPGLEVKHHEKTEERFTSNTGQLMDELWTYLVEEGNVLLLPAKLFLVSKEGEEPSDQLAFFRATFAGDLESIDRGLEALGKAVKEWFRRE